MKLLNQSAAAVAAVVASDFRIDPAGHVRMVLFVRADTGKRRVGRIVQRLCEIEVYRAMSMLGPVSYTHLTLPTSDLV